MIMIKRYSNRKLYDTQKKKYISLSEIQQIIQSGQEIRVINNDTGEEITSQILADIIAGAEKNQNGFLPQEMLASMIRMGQDRVVGFQHAFSLSTILSRIVDNEISRRLTYLHQAGNINETDRQQIEELLITKTTGESSPTVMINEYIQSLLQNAQIPSRNDFQSLQEQLNQLNLELDTLLQNEPGGENRSLSD
jgi:polyhydroxyalkanoate synthesis repressor PhaR